MTASRRPGERTVNDTGTVRPRRTRATAAAREMREVHAGAPGRDQYIRRRRTHGRRTWEPCAHRDMSGAGGYPRATTRSGVVRPTGFEPASLSFLGRCSRGRTGCDRGWAARLGRLSDRQWPSPPTGVIFPACTRVRSPAFAPTQHPAVAPGHPLFQLSYGRSRARRIPKTPDSPPPRGHRSPANRRVATVDLGRRGGVYGRW